MFKYTLYKSKANNASKGLWYPCIHYEETIDTRALAEHMASHSSATRQHRSKASSAT